MAAVQDAGLTLVLALIPLRLSGTPAVELMSPMIAFHRNPCYWRSLFTNGLVSLSFAMVGSM